MVADDSQPEPTPTPRPGGPPPRPYLVWVSHRFILLTLLSSILTAFAVGRTARVLLLDKPQRALLEYQKMLSVDRDAYDQDKKQQQQHHLPTPVLPFGKRLPRTSYTSKNFNTALGSSTDSRWVLAKVGNPSAAGAGSGSCRAGGGTGSCNDVPGLESEEDGEDEDEEEHQPAGQHLLIDIQYVDSHFLNSQERLANAMLQLINQCGLTLLSYHCHQLEPMGVTCVGVLLESHVSFHTWPADGVITLDLFTCGPNSLLPVVSVAETLFAIPQKKGGGDTKTTTTWKKPKIIWAHKLRGFRDNLADGGYLEDADLMSIGMVSKRNDYKKEVSRKTRTLQRLEKDEKYDFGGFCVCPS
jgi:S-adenosylmethionine decarboxylase proenzyme